MDALADRIRVAEVVYVDLSATEVRLRCQCGQDLGSADRSPKLGCAQATLLVQAIGPEVNPHKIGRERFVLREFYCPGCMARIEVEIARPDDPVLDDAIVSPEWVRDQARQRQHTQAGVAGRRSA